MRILAVIGTRPEAIKMLPLIIELKKHPSFKVFVCSTGQHTDMLNGVFEYFNIEPDYSFCAMRKGQSLSELTIRLLRYFDEILVDANPDTVLVHGDTTSAFCASLSAFYKGIKIVHVEAGLRTFNKSSPLPEEFNRVAIDAVADICLAPTDKAKYNLDKEGKSAVFTTGNTVIDSLKYTLDSGYSSPILDDAGGRKIVLLTMHRRENLGDRMRSALLGVRDILLLRDDLFCIFPCHPNPAVREAAEDCFADIKNIKICEPLSIYDFHNILSRSFAVLTDSGGIQEEASFLGVPVFLLRDTTERKEGEQNGNIALLGTDGRAVRDGFLSTVSDTEKLSKMSKPSLVFGNGDACEKIAKILLSSK